VKSLAIGFLLGMCVILGAAWAQSPPGPVLQYQLDTAASTWVINTGTGDVWQLNGEEGTGKFDWVYAGRPPGPGTNGRTKEKDY
jgi:hypothetical protein